jgi:hypothetical protein
MVEESEFDIGEAAASRSSKEYVMETATTSRFDSPGHQVQKLNRAILATKCLLALVLLAAAGGLAGLVHKFVGDSEKESFVSDFALVSNYIAEALVTDTSYVFELGQSAAVALTLLMKTSNTTQHTFALPVPEYRSLTSAATKAVYYATWNPLLRTDEDRRNFVEMVAKRDSEGYFGDETKSVCHLCGDENSSPSTPELVISVSGVGEHSSKLLYESGLDGLVTGPFCPILTKEVMAKCSCTAIDTSVAVDSTNSDRKPSEGLYRLAANKTLVDAPWTGGPYLPMWMDSTVFGMGNAILFDHLSHTESLVTASTMLHSGYAQVTEMYTNAEPTFYSVFHPRLLDASLGPQSVIYTPVYSTTGSDIVGAVSLPVNWFALLRNPVPSKGISLTS